MKTKTEVNIPDIREFTDEGGGRWVQTSPDDLFTSVELIRILENIEKEKNDNKVILARIDFQKVDREYYEAAIQLQNRLNSLEKLVKKLIQESRTLIDRKNSKLMELIAYIRQMHEYSAAGGTGVPVPAISISGTRKALSDVPADEAVYDSVKEIILSPDLSIEEQLKKHTP